MPLKFLTLLVLVSATVFGKSGPSATVIFTSNRQGEIEPCGCQVNQIGGLNRMAAYLEEERKKGALKIFDSGDTFFSATTLNPLQAKQEELRAELVADGYRKMGVDLFSPGERDFAKGLAFLKMLIQRAGVKAVSANLVDPTGQYLFERWTTWEVGGKILGITGLMNSALSGEEFQAKDAVTALTEVFEASGGKVHSWIVLSHLGLDGDREIAAKFPGLVVLGSHSMDSLDPSEAVGPSRIYQPMHEGQQLAKIVWDLEGKRAIEEKIISLGKEYDVKNPVQKMMVKYRAAVRKLALADEKTIGVGKKGGPGFVAQPSLCKDCHAKQHAFWETTKHASAYLVLYSKKQHLDAECIGCHSLGFREAGGFQRPKDALLAANPPKKGAFIDDFLKGVFAEDHTTQPLDSRKEPGRYEALKKKYHASLRDLENKGLVRQVFAGVQCEHCHGNRAGHPGVSGTLKKVSATSCLKCHTSDRSPGFQADWLKKIACPSRGESS